ncbi:MAG: penicillin-binding protein 2 [Kordiimonadaceae bacterium]|nr:penicillin-binding protein 2 [Kordiimonadaceae bacterium]
MNTAYGNSSLPPSDLRVGGIRLAHNRLKVAVFVFLLAFLLMAARTVELGVRSGVVKKDLALDIVVEPVKYGRADILDRNGEILATSLPSTLLQADRAKLGDPVVAARQLDKIFPQVSYETLYAKLVGGKGYVELVRQLTPNQKWAINAIGNPAFEFLEDEERIYPHGRLAAHVLGFVNVDGKGQRGIEGFLDYRLSQEDQVQEAVRLSLDIRVQYALTYELRAAMNAFQAQGAAGLVMDVNTGEVLAMVSLPDYDPSEIQASPKASRFNRAAQGVYELGSTFKTFTLANALDNGVVDLTDSFDASRPLRVGRFSINDDHPKNRVLTVPEIYTYSSNIGTAQIALEIGKVQQERFLGSLGLLERAIIELSAIGAPQLPSTWGKATVMTVAYGHGIAVSPLQLVRGIAAMVNGGRLVPATLIHNSDGWREGKRVIKPSTSRKIRQLMRMVVTKGTGKYADAIGYRVGGKTGTANISSAGGYDRKKKISSFVGVFPMDDPQYIVFALLDQPNGTKKTFGFSGGGWVAAPVVKSVIARTAPLLGIAPKKEDTSLYETVSLMIEE